MSYVHLTQTKRYQIEVLNKTGITHARIAEQLGVNPSTICRELKRGKDRHGRYQGEYAHRAALRRRRRSAANARRVPSQVWQSIARFIRRDWSPEQAWGWAQRFDLPKASVPAIYAWIHRLRRNGSPLYKHLRYLGRNPRRYRCGPAAWLADGRLSIRNRAAEARLRQQPGHWEGDTLIGSTSNPHRLLTLVERASRYVVIRRPKVHHGLADSVAYSTIHALRRLPTHSITFDNGIEFARHPRIARSLGCPVYFADPGRPDQRGTCENTIGLVRQYIPKGTSGTHLSLEQIQRIANRINDRPRKCLGFRTPNEVLFSKPPNALRT
jgi:IS30 family transposase